MGSIISLDMVAKNMFEIYHLMAENRKFKDEIKKMLMKNGQ